MEHTCPRCNFVINYVSWRISEVQDKTNCRKCKNIPDSSIEYFKQGKFVKHCSLCNDIQEYASKQGMLCAYRMNLICHSCSSKKKGAEVGLKSSITKSKWSPQKRASFAAKISKANKIRHANFSDKEKRVWAKRSRDARRQYFENLTPEKKEEWICNMRKAFDKYRGDAHWMKDPIVLQKVIDSCAKYKGKGHWFRRIGVLQRMLRTKKKKAFSKNE